MTNRTKMTVASAIMLAIVLIDQITKIYIKTHFVLHESYKVTSWFYLCFVENNGMAYGTELDSPLVLSIYGLIALMLGYSLYEYVREGKLSRTLFGIALAALAAFGVGMVLAPKYILTVFRIVAIGGFGWYLFTHIRKGMPWLLTVILSMIVAGAFGNLIDCVFYGQLFTDSIGHVATFADAAAGHLPANDWLQGRVVDMLYFPLIEFEWPDWMPRTGEMVDWGFMQFRWASWLPSSSEPFMFFKPVFNFADACISVGIALLFLCYWKQLSQHVFKEK
ncbi:MAG: signal peptidase II [Bacteroidales bacterium]|nr:signal peptidase II [Candidatus Liminaster caballi]